MDLTELFGGRYGGPMTGIERLNLGGEFRQLTTIPPENNNDGSFTALLEMPANQAMDLLRFNDSSYSQATVNRISGDISTFPSNSILLDRAARFSVNISGESAPSNLEIVKAEPEESDSYERLVKNQSPTQNPNTYGKRKEREKKLKSSMKKKKTKSSKEEEEEEEENLPYVHVRARRGQATDNHSLAERARREKINARMKMLQELVPGCDKIQGTALVLDEIINHVQSLQNQVEMLSMRLAAVNPRIEFDLDSILALQNGSLMDGSFEGESYHKLQQWPFDGYQKQEWGREDDDDDVGQANMLMDSATLHTNHVKMEL
ncbi:unnamed protein product [Cochlearia groenlandica]